MKKLLIYCDEPCSINGNNGVSSEYNWIEFTFKFSVFFDVTVLTPKLETDGKNLKCFKIPDKNYALRNVAAYKSFSSYLIMRPMDRLRLILSISNHVKKSDGILVRFPSQVCLLTFLLARIHRRPYYVYHAGSLRLVASVGLNSLVRNILIQSLDFVHKCISKKADARFTVDQSIYPNQKMISLYDGFSDKMVNIDAVSNYPKLDKLKVLRLASYVVNKNYELLFEVAKLLPTVTFNCFGKVVDRLYFEELKCAAPSNVNLISEVTSKEELNQLYCAHHLQIITSYSEGFPRVISEAAEFGLPTISADIGVSKPFIKHMA